MNPNASSSCSLKSRFTRGFLRALIRINRQRRRPTHMFRRYHRVKIAADKSMALAVGSTRAWSRAILWRIQHKAWRHHHRHLRRRRRAASASASSALIRSRNYMNKRRRDILKEQEKEKKSDEEEVGFSHAKELRKLVPGGEAMDLCSLLDETAHYIKCLATQVQVMRDIDQFYSI